ncbi:hypothetical protein BH23ACI1_BH23ACI1_12410 [soil metagenome]|nr:hypothetical protein [Acidobacteriota bacterium]
MANWCNVRVSVFGPREAVARFMKDAGHGTRGIDISRSTVFLPEMEVGEGGDLSAKEPATFGRRWHSSSPLATPMPTRTAATCCRPGGNAPG